MFAQKELTKVQNFKLFTAHTTLHQMCTLIGPFCWKYIKFKYKGFMSPGTEERCQIWRKTNLLFQNWQEFGEHSKVSKMCNLIGLFCAKYITFDLKIYSVQRSYIWWHWRLMQNFMENWLVLPKMTWENFNQGTQKLQNWDFDGIPLSRTENIWA